MVAVLAENLGKTFPGRTPVTALAQVSLAIGEGEIYGLLGPNGAGKTTLIALLTGLTTPDRGRVAVAGLDVATRLHQVQGRVNLVRGFSGVVEKFTARELLSYYAQLYGVGRGRVDEVLRRTGLWERRNREVATFSSGWRQRFFLAKGILNQPEVLFLDEPTVGLDVDAAREVRELIRSINRQGCTILLTTHAMAEAEALCDRIGLLAGGRLVSEGTAAELKGRVQRGEAIHIDGQLDAALRERLGRIPGVRSVRQGETGCCLRVAGPGPMTPVLALLVAAGAPFRGIRFAEPTLEEVFLELTRQRLEEDHG